MYITAKLYRAEMWNFGMLLKHVSDHFSVLFEFAWPLRKTYIILKIEEMGQLLKPGGLLLLRTLSKKQSV